jgi:hypothetical protein
MLRNTASTLDTAIQKMATTMLSAILCCRASQPWPRIPAHLIALLEATA